MTVPYNTPSEADDFGRKIADAAHQVADLLSSMTPYERALVLRDAELLWDERDHGRSPDHEAGEEAMFLISQWLSQVFLRLSPPAQAGIIEVVKRLDDAERFDRLLEAEE